jgi:hypothetical protein
MYEVQSRIATLRFDMFVFEGKWGECASNIFLFDKILNDRFTIVNNSITAVVGVDHLIVDVFIKSGRLIKSDHAFCI